MSSATVTIRLARPEDAAGIAAVLRDVGWFTHINDEPREATEARVVEQLARCNGDDSHSAYVAVEPSERIAGYVAVHWFPNLMKGADGYVSELFLREAARGQGVGRLLLAAVEAEGTRRGATRLMLFNRRLRDSYQRRFYPKAGWYERDDVAFFMYDLPVPD